MTKLFYILMSALFLGFSAFNTVRAIADCKYQFAVVFFLMVVTACAMLFVSIKEFKEQ